LIPDFIRIGKTINKVRDGIINHKILVERALTFSTFFVSKYSQTIESTETSGMDTIIPPINVSFFEISDTIIIIPDDINSLIKN
tara:strand:- start:1076 stop:1327 length:252 start_codon:yes stop_codon:yes gene_type:complete